MDTEMIIAYAVMGLLVCGIAMYILCFETPIRVKAEVIDWTWEIKKFNWEWDDPWGVQPLIIHIFVKTKYGKKDLQLIWERGEDFPVCVCCRYKMEVMVPLLGRKERGKWWINAKDVRRC